MNIFAVVTGLIMTFVGMTIVSFNIEGHGGLAVTTLTAPIGITDTTIPVSSTDGFLNADVVFIGGEAICYTGKTSTSLTGAFRGCRETEAARHVTGARVYNEATSTINQVIGFNIAETMSTAGAIRVVTMVPGALMHAFPKLVMWDYSYLEGDLFSFPLAYVKYFFLYPLSGGFLIAVVILMINVFMGIARIFS